MTKRDVVREFLGLVIMKRLLSRQDLAERQEKQRGRDGIAQLPGI